MPREYNGSQDAAISKALEEMMNPKDESPADEMDRLGSEDNSRSIRTSISQYDTSERAMFREWAKQYRALEAENAVLKKQLEEPKEPQQ